MVNDPAPFELRLADVASYGFGLEGGSKSLSVVSHRPSAASVAMFDVRGILANGMDPYGHHRQSAIVVQSEASVLEQPETVRSRVRHGWEHIQGRLRAFAKLPHNWDGEAGDAPPVVVTHNAQSFVLDALRHEVPVPELYIDGGGEVGFRWRRFDWFASVSFLDDGHGVGYIETARTPAPIRVDACWPWQDAANRKIVFEGLRAFA